MARTPNPLTAGGPRDTVHSARQMIAMLEEMFLDRREGDSMSDEASSGVAYTLGCIGSALEEAEEQLDTEAKATREAKNT